MVKISALPPMTTAADDDEAPIVDKSVTTTKKWTLSLLTTYLKSLTNFVITAMITDAAVTPPKWYNPYKFRAYLNAAANTGNAVFAKIPFDSENYDTNNNFDSTTNRRYTAPVAGYYHIGWFTLVTQVPAGTYDTALYKNGAEIAHGGRDNVNTVQVDTQGATDLQLAASDYLEVFSRSSSAAIALGTGSNNTYFYGHLISIT